MGTPINDTRDWPLCRVLLPREPMSAADLEAHLLTIGRFFATGEPFALLIDGRTGITPKARERRIITRNMAEWYRRCPSGLVGIAMVLSSALQRGALTAIQWAAGETFPCRAFAAPEPAEVWLRAALVASKAAAGTGSRRGFEFGKRQS